MCCSFVRDFIHVPIYWQFCSLHFCHSSSSLYLSLSFLRSFPSLSFVFFELCHLFHSHFMCIVCLCQEYESKTFLWNSSIRTHGFLFHSNPFIRQRKDEHFIRKLCHTIQKNYLLMLFLTCWRCWWCWWYIYKTKQQTQLTIVSNVF